MLCVAAERMQVLNTSDSSGFQGIPGGSRGSRWVPKGSVNSGAGSGVREGVREGPGGFRRGPGGVPGESGGVREGVGKAQGREHM